MDTLDPYETAMMDPKKRRAVEGVQALTLQLDTARDYLDACLEALINEDFPTAELYMQLVKDNGRIELETLMSVIRSEGLN